MKKVFRITDKKLISSVLDEAGYGVLALAGASPDQPPYAVPVNFAFLNGAVYFHSSPKGKKMTMLRANPYISFSVVRDEVIIPSYFSTIKGSSMEGMACPASSFFKSVTIDGVAEVVESREEVAAAFTALMQKLQPEGGYKPFEHADYDKHFAALAVVKINIEAMSAKFKFGQSLSAERFDMVVEHLEKRGREIDLRTAETMRRLYGQQRT